MKIIPMTLFLVLSTLSLECSAQFHRFYRGYTHKELDLTKYVANMNKDFFPKTSKFVVLKKNKIAEKTVNFGEGMDAQW